MSKFLVGRRAFTGRVAPGAVVLAVWAVATLAYRAAPMLGHLWLCGAAAQAAGMISILALLFGAPAAYIPAFYRGASTAERALAALITPFAWILSELARVSAFFTPAETLYYAFNPVFVQAVFFTVMLMGVSETVCRLALRRRGAMHVKVLTAGPAAAMVSGIGAFIVIFAWGRGVHAFYLYMSGYRALFF